MGLTTNTDISSILNKVQGYAAQNGGGSSTGAWFNNYTDLWTYAKTLEEGSGEQKAQAVQGLMEKVISFAKSAIANREAEAQKTSTKNNNDAQNAANKQKDAKAELGKPFPQEEELKTKSARLAELDAELNLDRPENKPQAKDKDKEEPDR